MFRPVAAGLWQQRETFDGTYSFVDLMDAHELLDVREENQRIAQAYQEQLNQHG